jgi:CheY-like chemotaxis protein
MAADRYRILVVEDNPETQLLVKHLLKKDYDVEVVSGVDAALEAADAQHFDVFLLDINLGEPRTGTDLLHLLDERGHTDTAASIALTAYAMPGDREDFVREGFDGYVSKPFTRRDLHDAVTTCLEAAAEDQP